MSTELIGIIAVGLTLAGLILTLGLWVGSWIRGVDRRLGDHIGEFKELRGELRARFAIQNKDEAKDLIDHFTKAIVEGRHDDG